MAMPKPSPSNNMDSPTPSSTGASWFSSLRQSCYWWLSALSGTVETEEEIKRLRIERQQLKQETEQLRQQKLQLRSETDRLKNETAQLKSETERLRQQNAKIDAIFSKYDINSTPVPKTEQP
ncbi:hypothetical protein [Synechococcus elongatus]|uniref:hypothetical protein n=1 Tax=Synechococcus elongatus TaxID=32046 RepID=UPI003CC8D270